MVIGKKQLVVGHFFLLVRFLAEKLNHILKASLISTVQSHQTLMCFENHIRTSFLISVQTSDFIDTFYKLTMQIQIVFYDDSGEVM